MKLLDSPGFWMGVSQWGGNKTQTTKMKEKKKTEQEQALKADLHVALCCWSKIADLVCALNPSQV